MSTALPAGSHLIGARTIPLVPQGPKDSVYVEAKLDGHTSVGVWSKGLPHESANWDDVTIPEERIGLVTDGHFSAFAVAGRDPVGNFAGKRRQITNAWTGGGYVLWVETPDTDLGGNEWTIRSYLLSTHQVRTVDHSPYLPKGYRLAGDSGSTQPLLLGGYVYWTTAVPRHPRPNVMKGADWSFQVQRRRVDGTGRTETIATNAALAAVTDDALFYATGKVLPGGSARFTLHRRGGGTGRDQEIVHGFGTGTARLTNVTAGDGQLVWTVRSPNDNDIWDPQYSTPGQLYVMDLASGQVTMIVTRDDAGPNYSFDFGPQILLWGNGSGNGDPSQFVLELETGQVYRLGATQGFSLVLAARATASIMWGKECPTKKEPARTCFVTATWRS